jgi:thiosulfate/3-mercaptopyruvate sulfurtransferase
MNEDHYNHEHRHPKCMSHYDTHPAVCTPNWLRDHLEQVSSNSSDYRLVEVDSDQTEYDDWHIPGAVNIDWEQDLINELGGGLVTKPELEQLLGNLGITPETEVIVYGDKANWFAAHAYWVLKYYGHENVTLLDGGRRYWEQAELETTDTVPEFSEREYEITQRDAEIRASKEEVMDAIDGDTSIIDVRNPQEYRGEKPPAEIPDTTDQEGHIPSADNIPWGRAVDADGTLKHPEELQYIYDEYDAEDDNTVTYCRIGERSSITWFVLHELLDVDCRNYDGSWTEWADDEATPIEVGGGD